MRMNVASHCSSRSTFPCSVSPPAIRGIFGCGVLLLFITAPVPTVPSEHHLIIKLHPHANKTNTTTPRHTSRKPSCCNCHRRKVKQKPSSLFQLWRDIANRQCPDDNLRLRPGTPGPRPASAPIQRRRRRRPGDRARWPPRSPSALRRRPCSSRPRRRSGRASLALPATPASLRRRARSRTPAACPFRRGDRLRPPLLLLPVLALAFGVPAPTPSRASRRLRPRRRRETTAGTSSTSLQPPLVFRMTA